VYEIVQLFKSFVVFTKKYRNVSSCLLISIPEGSSVGEKLGKEQREESYTISKRSAVSIVAFIKLIFSLCIVET
jgi:hypothetical protein